MFPVCRVIMNEDVIILGIKIEYAFEFIGLL
jgi:hypothetical protein